jgi:hypothetical protein
MAEFRAGTPAGDTTSPPPGAVRRTLVTAGILLGALLLFGLLGRKADDGEWALPYEFADWHVWIGEARTYLYPGFALWLAYLFAAPASKTVARAVIYGLLLVPALILMSETAVVIGWAGGTIGMYVLLVIGLVAAVILLAARRRLDGTEVQPFFGRADVGGLLLGVFVAILAAAPEYRDLIEAIGDGDIDLADALKITEVPALHWFVFGPSVTLAFAGLAAAIGRFVALTAPAVTRWLPRIAAAALAIGAFVALSRIGTDLFGW